MNYDIAMVMKPEQALRVPEIWGFHNFCTIDTIHGNNDNDNNNKKKKKKKIIT
jgi:hypothetical protein